MTALRCDICIIGAGAGGLSLAAGAAQMGARVVLVEGGQMGGDCLNHGCVPSKALLAAAKAAAGRTKGAGLGIAPDGAPRVDFAAVRAHVAATIAAIAPHDSQARFEALGVTVLRDWARFTAPDRLQAGDTSVRARRFVIATGARPALPPIPGIEGVAVLTNETLFDLPELPAHLMVLGGGPIGVEMALAFRRLGAEVTLVEPATLLAREEPQAAALIAEALQAEGVRLCLGRAVVRLRALDTGVEAVLEDGQVIAASHLLAATGRRPALDRLDLPAARVQATAQGVTVGAGLRSVSNRRVYAVGDAAGQGQFTHLAGAQAAVVARQILLGLPARAPQHVPAVTFTDPELARAGLTEAEARRIYGGAVRVITRDLAEMDRARAEGLTAGLLKLIVVRGRPVGATLVAPAAGEMIGLWQLAIARRMPLSALAGLVLPYPTLGESAKQAAGAYFSAQIFDNPALKRVVRLVQRLVP